MTILPLVGGAFSSVFGAFDGVKVSDFYSGELRSVTLLYGGYFLFVAVFVIWRAFRRKRSLLLPGWENVERLRDRRPLPENGRNVYRSEEELFDALGRGRPMESPIDLFVQVFIALIAALYAVALVPEDVGLLVFMLVVEGPPLAIVVSASLHHRQRRWR